MTRWDWSLDPSWASPWGEFERMRHRMNRVLRELAGLSVRTELPAVNVWSDQEKALVTAEVPGVKPEDIDLTVMNDTLTICGSRKPEPLKEGEHYVRQERESGSFARAIALPFAVDAKKVSASYKDGLLKVTLPRSEAQRPARIQIQG